VKEHPTLDHMPRFYKVHRDLIFETSNNDLLVYSADSGLLLNTITLPVLEETYSVFGSGTKASSHVTISHDMKSLIGMSSTTSFSDASAVFWQVDLETYELETITDVFV